MRRFGMLICAAVAIAPSVVAADLTPAEALAKTLAKMDEAAARFKGFSAQLERVSHQDAIHEHEIETGKILVKRLKGKDLHVRIEFEKPESKLAVFNGNKVEVYYPKSGLIQTYELGRSKSMVDVLVALGFGGNSKDLLKDYTVELGGPETVAGEITTRLQLIPKTQIMLEQYKRVELWISDKSGYTVRQKFYPSGKDYDQATYTNVKSNVDVPDSAFRLEPPKGTKRETVIKK